MFLSDIVILILTNLGATNKVLEKKMFLSIKSCL